MKNRKNSQLKFIFLKINNKYEWNIILWLYSIQQQFPTYGLQKISNVSIFLNKLKIDKNVI